MSEFTHKGRVIRITDDLWLDPAQVSMVSPHKSSTAEAPVASIVLNNGREVLAKIDHGKVVNLLNNW